MRGQKLAEKHCAEQSTVVTSLSTKLADMEHRNEFLQRDLQNFSIETEKISQFLLFHNLPSENVLNALTVLIANATQSAQTIQLLKSSIIAKDLKQFDLQSQLEHLQSNLNERQIQHDSLNIIANDKVAECEHLTKRLHSICIDLDNNRNLQCSTKALETALAIERMKLQRQIKENESLEISVGNFTRSHERMKAELEAARQQRPITPSKRISLQNPLVDNKAMVTNQSDVMVKFYQLYFLIGFYFSIVVFNVEWWKITGRSFRSRQSISDFGRKCQKRSDYFRPAGEMYPVAES